MCHPAVPFALKALSIIGTTVAAHRQAEQDERYVKQLEEEALTAAYDKADQDYLQFLAREEKAVQQKEILSQQFLEAQSQINMRNSSANTDWLMKNLSTEYGKRLQEIDYGLQIEEDLMPYRLKSYQSQASNRISQARQQKTNPDFFGALTNLAQVAQGYQKSKD